MCTINSQRNIKDRRAFKLCYRYCCWLLSKSIVVRTIRGAKIKYENVLFGWERKEFKVVDSVGAEITAIDVKD